MRRLALGALAVMAATAVHGQDIKKMALVSVYMNRNFYNLDRSASKPERFTIGNAVADVFESTAPRAAHEAAAAAIVEEAQKTLAGALGAAGSWEVMPADAGLNAVHIGAVVSPTEAELKWLTPSGMPPVPIDLFNAAGSDITAGRDIKFNKKLRERLAALANAMDVDAVAVVHVDMAYKKKRRIVSILGDEKLAIPSVDYSIAIVDRRGELRMRLNDLENSRRFEGPEARFLHADKFSLHHDEKAAVAYGEAVRAAAEDLRASAANRLSKTH